MALRISLFGSVRIARDDGPDVRLTGQMRDLFAYLVLNRNRSHSREVLAGVFWGEQPESRARGCLSTAVWRLRTAFELTGLVNGSPILIERDAIAFDAAAGHWLDVAEFESAVAGALKQPLEEASRTVEVDRLEAALNLYRGDLLEGCYQDWAQQEQHRLHTLYVNGLELQMHCLATRGELERSLSCGHQILQLDPLREAVHRAVMRLHLQHGQRAQALRQFEICRSTLVAELGVPPMRETQELYAEILAANAALEHGPPPPARRPVAAAPVEETLRAVRDDLNTARARVDHAMELLQRLSGTNPLS